jgi:aromatic ring-opening dioxygenase LigB subunit
MTLKYSTILPHGFNLIEDIYPNPDIEWKELIDSMKTIAQEIYSSEPQVIIIASPHNLRIDGQIGLITAEWLEGTWWNEDKSLKAELKVKTDRETANLIYARGKQLKLPIVAVNYGAAGGDISSMKMDWGTLIPLWYINKVYEENNKEFPPIVLITPSREIPWSDLVELGKLINGVCVNNEISTVFIASCDHGHAHYPDGPYGYHPASKVFDEQILSWIKNSELEKLLTLSPEFIEQAKPDSFWQMLILLGILEVTDLKNDMCVYGCPEYYGMIVASYKS